MNIYLWIIVAALLLEYFLHTFSRFLDLKNLSTVLPAEFVDYYSSEEYARSQQYLKENTMIIGLLSTLIVLVLANIATVWFKNSNSDLESQFDEMDDRFDKFDRWIDDWIEDCEIILKFNRWIAC